MHACSWYQYNRKFAGDYKLKFHKFTYSEILRIYGVSGPSLLIESMIVKQGTFSYAIVCESVGKNLDVL